MDNEILIECIEKQTKILGEIKSSLSKLISIESYDRNKSDARIKDMIKNKENTFNDFSNGFISNSQTVITVATTAQPDPDDIAGNPAGSTGYDKIQIYQILGRKASCINIKNDGTTDLLLIISHDGKSWSESELLIEPGEVRSFYDIYEIRIRSAVAGVLSTMIGGIYRLTEFNIIPSNISLNRLSFTTLSAQNISNALPATQLNDVAIPDGFALVVRSNVNNNADIYLANSSANTNVATSRITLTAGDSVRLYITNANLVYVLGSAANQDVDYFVEL